VKAIGLIGGMSWGSSLSYYRIINEAVKAKLGGFHSAKCILYSVGFGEIEHLQAQEKWQEMAHMLIDAARSVERGGADFVILCTNTMHKMTDEIQASKGIILGCTEIGLLVQAGDCRVPLFDTTEAHATAASRICSGGVSVNTDNSQLLKTVPAGVRAS
jgi:aspartate/glutamate racemase